MLTIDNALTKDLYGNQLPAPEFKEPGDWQQLQNERYSSDTADRKWLAQWQAVVVSVWLFSVVGILICNGSKLNLSDTVLSVLLGTTTLNVLGLSFIVLRGHFPSSGDWNTK